VLLVALAVLRFLPHLVIWAVLVLAADYLFGLPVRAGSLAAAAAYGLALLVVAELAYLSFELATPVHGEPGTWLGRAAMSAAVVAVTVVADDVALGAAYFSGGGGLLLATAVVSAVLIVGVVALLLRRRHTGQP
jgi:hypothetical protein